MSTSSNPIVMELMTKYGFTDDSLITPAHDAIMAWLDDNVDQIIHDFYAVNNVDYMATLSKLEINDHRWECPFVNDKGYIRGYADLAVGVITSWVRDTNDHYPYTKDTMFYFEVKPEIRSVGEVMRQINGYVISADQCNERTTNYFFLVSPDDRFSNLFESQGIHFIKVIT